VAQTIAHRTDMPLDKRGPGEPPSAWLWGP